MKKMIIGKIIKYIEKEKDIDKEEKEIIIYGLESIYILITKLIIILLLASILGILKETLIFFGLFNIIRIFAFGIHATKSYICLIVSILIFLGLPLLSMIIEIPLILKVIIGSILTLLILKNSPADTIKRPIINKKRRLFFKVVSTIIATIYTIIACLSSGFICNCLLFSLLVESILTSPITYKIFNLPYNNYLNYKEKEV